MPSGVASKRASALGLVSSVTAFLSAAACCVLPLMLGWLGIGASGLAVIVPYHWPLTILALVAVAAAWGLFAWQTRTRRARRSTVVMLTLASVLTLISTFWEFIEQPLMRLLA